jgi:hypothetical protein
MSFVYRLTPAIDGAGQAFPGMVVGNSTLRAEAPECLQHTIFCMVPLTAKILLEVDEHVFHHDLLVQSGIVHLVRYAR